LGDKQEVDDVELASGFSIANYQTALANIESGRQIIADAIHRRFTERYLGPITDPPSDQRHGFAMMAVACLMIEALQSFRCGWLDTSKHGEGKHAFCSFFDEHSEFAPLRGHAGDFYKNVRCGILHQAETTNGWRIRRNKVELLTHTPTGLIIDAKRFTDALGRALDRYRDDLKAAPWDDDLWDHLKRKMNRVCDNCKSITKGVA
jgi:hypothetical protein